VVRLPPRHSNTSSQTSDVGGCSSLRLRLCRTVQICREVRSSAPDHPPRPCQTGHRTRPYEGCVALQGQRRKARWPVPTGAEPLKARRGDRTLGCVVRHSPQSTPRSSVPRFRRRPPPYSRPVVSTRRCGSHAELRQLSASHTGRARDRGRTDQVPPRALSQPYPGAMTFCRPARVPVRASALVRVSSAMVRWPAQLRSASRRCDVLRSRRREARWLAPTGAEPPAAAAARAPAADATAPRLPRTRRCGLSPPRRVRSTRTTWCRRRTAPS
jgi:hypothetical protein